MTGQRNGLEWFELWKSWIYILNSKIGVRYSKWTDGLRCEIYIDFGNPGRNLWKCVGNIFPLHATIAQRAPASSLCVVNQQLAIFLRFSEKLLIECSVRDVIFRHILDKRITLLEPKKKRRMQITRLERLRSSKIKCQRISMCIIENVPCRWQQTAKLYPFHTLDDAECRHIFR